MNTIAQWWHRHVVVVKVDVVALLRAGAAVLVGVALLIAMLGFMGAREHSDSRADSLQATLDAKTAVDTCRAQVASAVTDATTTYLFALGHRAGAQDGLVIALAVHGSIPDALAALDTARQRLDEAGLVLDAARDARVAFEAKPTGGCTGDRPNISHPTASTSTSAPPTTAGPTTSTVKVTLHPTRAASPPTTRAPLARSDDRPPPPHPPATPVTTRPPAPLCDLIPTPTVTVPVVTTCL